MEIKVIENKDFLDLVTLNAEMYKAMDSNINQVGATASLMHIVSTKEDFIAFGLFEDNKLVGFVTGYNFLNKTFHFSGIYVMIKNNRNLKKLIDFCFDYIKNKGYSTWQVDATNGNISSIMEKYGAIKKYTRYYKELS